MKPVFATSAWVTAREKLILRGGRNTRLRLPVRYGLVLHPTAGPVLIDSGYTLQAVKGTERSTLLRIYSALLRPDLNTSGQPEPFLARFGLKPADIRFVILTHYHADHVSGLNLFSSARFIASDDAWARIEQRSTLGNLRHGIFPELLPADFADRLVGLSSLPRIEPGHDLPSGVDLFGDGSLIAIDLPGHADGHFGILFKAMERPVLYGVDAQWLLPAIFDERTPGYPARLIAADYPAITASNETLRRFAAAGGELLICHDPQVSAYDIVPGDPR